MAVEPLNPIATDVRCDARTATRKAVSELLGGTGISLHSSPSLRRPIHCGDEHTSNSTGRSSSGPGPDESPQLEQAAVMAMKPKALRACSHRRQPSPSRCVKEAGMPIMCLAWRSLGNRHSYPPAVPCSSCRPRSRTLRDTAHATIRSAPTRCTSRDSRRVSNVAHARRCEAACKFTNGESPFVNFASRRRRQPPVHLWIFGIAERLVPVRTDR